MSRRKKKAMTPEQVEQARTKDFFDCILPGTVKFFTDHYILGDSYRCVWVIREYPPSTEEQAILSQLADHSGITLRIYHRLVESMEQRKIIQNATRRNKLKSGGSDVNETIEAEGNLQDVIEMLANLRKNREPLLHCSVFIELKAKSLDTLKELQSEIAILQTHIRNYARTRNAYVGYRKAGYSKKYLAEHEADITLHKAAKKYFDEQGIQKLPTIKALQAEYAELLEEKKTAYAQYRKAREEMKELQIAKANIDTLLKEDAESKSQPTHEH